MTTRLTSAPPARVAAGDGRSPRRWPRRWRSTAAFPRATAPSAAPLGRRLRGHAGPLLQLRSSARTQSRAAALRVSRQVARPDGLHRRRADRPRAVGTAGPAPPDAGGLSREWRNLQSADGAQQRRALGEARAPAPALAWGALPAGFRHSRPGMTIIPPTHAMHPHHMLWKARDGFDPDRLLPDPPATATPACTSAADRASASTQGWPFRRRRYRPPHAPATRSPCPKAIRPRRRYGSPRGLLAAFGCR